MTSQTNLKLAELHSILDAIGHAAVAVSGGVDSMTLAHIAHRRLGSSAMMFHAVSPAVPREATERVRRHAERSCWSLELIDAGEFSDRNYLENPVNRCFYCKHNLYSTISMRSDHAILSGTNFNDLQDFRPGLDAARQHRVVHPYVEARIDKGMVRRIASSMDLDDLAELPASPCLSSRVETGIHVTADILIFVHAVESVLVRELGNATVRCRLRKEGPVIELRERELEMVLSGGGVGLRDEIGRLGLAHGLGAVVRFERYRRGSAFLRGAP